MGCCIGKDQKNTKTESNERQTNGPPTFPKPDIDDPSPRRPQEHQPKPDPPPEQVSESLIVELQNQGRPRRKLHFNAAISIRQLFRLKSWSKTTDQV